MNIEKISKMVFAINAAIGEELPINEPDGSFHRKVIIECGKVKIDSDFIDLEFDIPFSDSEEWDEAEINIYNLATNTVSQFKYNDTITITAGYKDDIGLIFSGRICSVKTKWYGNDKKTSITAIDSQSLKEKMIKDTAYKKGVKASYVLKNLIGKTGVPIAVFKCSRDFTYKDGLTISGGINENIKKMAHICGISAYIHKGKWYVRSIKDGDNINFTVNKDTGLIGSPEEFEETEKNEDFTDITKGYKIKMLLQYRIETASIINLSSVEIKGQFRVRDGRHLFDGNNFITEFNCI